MQASLLSQHHDVRFSTFQRCTANRAAVMEPGNWTWLETTKLAAGLLTPVAVAVFGIFIHHVTKRFEHAQWRSQKLVEKRLAVYDDLAPQLNDVLCYFTYVGGWRDLEPLSVVALKRLIDKKIHLAAPLFSREFYSYCSEFQELCFETYVSWGRDARLRTRFERRRDALATKWIVDWETCFSPNPTDPGDVREAYRRVMAAFAVDIGVNGAFVIPHSGETPENIERPKHQANDRTTRPSDDRKQDERHNYEATRQLDSDLKSALLHALKIHNIGRNGDSHTISYSNLGRSGASFGAMQGDLAIGPDFVRQTMRNILSMQGLDETTIAGLIGKLSRPQVGDPLGPSELQVINTALSVQRAQVAAMDQQIAEEVFSKLDECIAAARQGGRTIDSTAQLYIGLWINMTGNPTRLKEWLGGSSDRTTPPGNPVSKADIERFLLTSKYYAEHPRNFQHLRDSVAEGVLLLQQQPDVA
jgi:hypothetical protein